ncbi:MAG: HEAT repeat domain-containing protein [Planctomycetota bacterium]
MRRAAFHPDKSDRLKYILYTITNDASRIKPSRHPRPPREGLRPLATCVPRVRLGDNAWPDTPHGRRRSDPVVPTPQRHQRRAPVLRRVSHGLAILLLMMVSPMARGQDDPFSDTPAARPKPAPASGSDETEEEEESTEASKIEELLADEDDPLVLAIVETKPETPSGLFRDVRALLNLDRFELAKEYLRQWLSTEPDAAEMSRLQAEFGSAFFLRLSNITEMQPVGTEVAGTVMEAAGERFSDPARLSALVEQLSHSDPAERRSALAELVKAGSVAAVPMIKALGDESREAEHEAIRAALVAMDDEAVPPLIAALTSKNESLCLEAMAILGQLESKEAVPVLLSTALAPKQDSDPAAAAARDMIRNVLGAIPSRGEAIRFLSNRLDEFLEGSVPGPIDQNEHVTRWTWDADEETPRRAVLPVADASIASAARVAEQLHRIAPDNTDFHRIYLATGLEHAKRRHGYDRPLSDEMGAIHDAATGAEVELLEEVLQICLEKQLEGAAIAVVDLLGQSNDPQVVLTNDGQTSVLVESLKSHMRHVQFAAARAVMNIDPRRPYPGSSHLSETLAYLAATSGERRVLIGNPWTDQAQRWIGLLNTLGFVADKREVGRELMLQAFSSSDYEFFLISDAIDHPPYGELIQMLRRDYRTAGLPIGLIARQRNMTSAEWFAETDARLLTLAPPQNKEDVARDARRLLATAGRAHISLEQRIEQATFALDALARLAEHPEQYPFYDLIHLDEPMEQALSTRGLATKAAAVLGFLGTPLAQRALLDAAGTQLRPLVERQAAAEAFDVAVSRRGLLLNRKQILRQYEKYNASESLDRDTQEVLSSILDTIEAPSRTSDSDKD